MNDKNENGKGKRVCNGARMSLPIGGTGVSKRNGAKFRELSFNFPKLAAWLCMGLFSCLASLRREFSKTGTFILHDPVYTGLWDIR